jgi:hypothetical protein
MLLSQIAARFFCLCKFCLKLDLNRVSLQKSAFVVSDYCRQFLDPRLQLSYLVFFLLKLNVDTFELHFFELFDLT